MLVLGLSNDSMNLITEFGELGEFGESAASNEFDESGEFGDRSRVLRSKKASGSLDPALENLQGSSRSGPDLGSSSLFNDVLQSENSKPSKGNYEFVPDVRSRIKSRLEGLKPL